MESWLWQLGALLLLLFIFTIYTISSSSKLPPGPRALPIIGHLHLLGDLPHVTLARFSKIYGPLLFLRFGSMPAVVVSSPDMAKEFLLTHDREFAGRPPIELSQRFAYGRENSVVFESYGARWRELRSLFTIQLFSSKRLLKLQDIRAEELRRMLRGIEEQSQGGKLPVNVSEFLGALMSDMVGRMVFSDRISEGSALGGASLKHLIRKVSALFATPLIGDVIPYLGWLDMKLKRSMNEFHSLLDVLLEDILTKRQEERNSTSTDAPRDFLDVLLSMSMTSNGEAPQRNTVKGLLLDLLAAGIDTSSNTVDWAMAELLKNPYCLMKLQKELDTIVQGRKGGMLEESDTHSLPYLSFVIKETFRLHPPGPLLIPHVSLEACTVAGYTLPKNTRLFVNVWAIGRDPQIWKNPHQFWPERFEDKDVNVKGQNFELIPFGSGRRSCPAMALGLSMVALTLSNLVHSFHWELPIGMGAMDVDMREVNGVTLGKATPVLAIPKPRLPPKTT